MSDLKTKSSLSNPQRQLLELLQNINFGRLEALHVRNGQPDFQIPPRIIRKLKIGGENGPRPEVQNSDFRLKDQQIEMLEEIAAVGDGTVLSIEVKHGLAFSMEIEHRADAKGGHHG